MHVVGEYAEQNRGAGAQGAPRRPHSFLPCRPPRGHSIPSEARTLSSDKKYYDLTTCGFRRFGSAVTLQIKCRE